LTVNYQTRQAGRVKVCVYNISGELVTTLLDQNSAVGSASLPWNGRNAKGDVVGNGVYFLLVETPGGKEVRKVIVLK